MLDNKNLNLRKDEIKRIKFLKNEINYNLLKSIINNQQIKPKYRAFANYKLQRTFLFFTQQKNYCLLTARSRGVWKFCNMSRHQINKFAKLGYLINIKPHNEK